jgi:hypothetical protein
MTRPPARFVLLPIACCAAGPPRAAAESDAPPRFETSGSVAATILSSRHPFFEGRLAQ